jgi:anti-anti-sigma regulatory factor
VEKTAFQNRGDGEREAAATAVIALPSRLDLAFANDLLTGILTRSGDPILTLDGSDVDYAATPCVQILLAAGRKRDATNCSLVIRHASDAFRRAIDDFGLQPDFSKWMV